MNHQQTTHSDVIDRETWRVWGHKGKLRDQAAARKRKVRAGITFVILALGAGFYALTVR